uniref:Transposon protein, putative, unclassified n=2 Tax=Oryza sativa subsp. japonica TaxID=39947 RepID=Q8H8V0_ORYSJ|nr:hypothetical protein [Oryza sativa Japonica Group]ABF95321.1 transposon protein, putative, unclassified [Oryza sativa Japonica Group]
MEVTRIFLSSLPGEQLAAVQGFPNRRGRGYRVPTKVTVVFILPYPGGKPDNRGNRTVTGGYLYVFLLAPLLVYDATTGGARYYVQWCYTLGIGSQGSLISLWVA